VNNKTQTQQSTKVYTEHYYQEIFIGISKRHEDECAKIVNAGKLVLSLKEELVSTMEVRLGIKFSDHMTTPEYEKLWTALKNRMKIPYNPRRPVFYGVKLSNNKWYLNLTTGSTAVAHALLKKESRINLKGYGGIDWAFPGTLATKSLLHKMKRKNLITDWHLSKKGARIVIHLTNKTLYTIRNSVEVAGLATIPINADHLNRIVGNPSLFYCSAGLNKRNEVTLRQFLNSS